MPMLERRVYTYDRTVQLGFIIGYSHGSQYLGSLLVVLLPIWKLCDRKELEEIVDLRVIRVHLFVDLPRIVLWCELPVRVLDLRGADSDSVLGTIVEVKRFNFSNLLCRQVFNRLNRPEGAYCRQAT